MAEHAGQNDEDNLRTAQIQLIDLPLRLAGGIGNDGILDVEVHLILGLEEEAADQFAPTGFDGYDPTLRVVEEDDGDADPVVANY